MTHCKLGILKSKSPRFKIKILFFLFFRGSEENFPLERAHYEGSDDRQNTPKRNRRVNKISSSGINSSSVRETFCVANIFRFASILQFLISRIDFPLS